MADSMERARWCPGAKNEQAAQRVAGCAALAPPRTGPADSPPRPSSADRARNTALHSRAGLVQVVLAASMSARLPSASESPGRP